jgi:prolipoprotein diacylglyceryl transferase
VTTTVLAYIPSPSQGVWHLGPVPIRAYAFFIIVGIVVALVIGDRRWQQRGGEPGVVYDMVFWAVGFGLLGGRLYHVITDWDKYFSSTGAGFVGALRIWDGGLGIWGAVALGGVGAWIGCRRRGIPLPAFGDAIAPGIILAQAIGRLGNYFNQELYGGPTTLPWALEIYERKNAAGVVDNLNGVSTGVVVHLAHPTFLYELLWNLLVFAALILIDRRFKIGHGRLFAMYVAGYCFGRFWIELIRVDEANTFADIRINSFTSTFVFIGAVIYIMVAPKGREDPASLKGKPRAPEKVEDTSVEEFVKELTGVAAATTGVGAAAKVAGEAEDEDAKAAAGEEAEEAEEPSEAAAEGEEAEEKPEKLSEAAAEGEALAEDVAEAPSEEIAGAEEFAEAKEAAEEAEEEAEAAVEAEELAEGVTGAPSGEIAGAEEFAAGGEAVGEAEEPSAEGAREAAVAEGDEVAAEAEPEEAETEGVEAVADDEGEEAEQPSPGAEEAGEPDGQADEEAAVEEAEASESEQAEPADEAEGLDAGESEIEDAEAAVEEAEAEPFAEESAEMAEAVVEEAEAAEAQEPEAEILTEEPEPDATAEADPTGEQQPEGGRLRRWLRGRRNR